MDPHHFDTFTRSLVASRANRRWLIAAIIAPLAGLVARLGLNQAAGGCAGKGANCSQHGDCCSNLRCRDGRCRCQRGSQWCDSGACVNLQTSTEHCGACFNSCANPASCCLDGQCQSPNCDGACCQDCFAPTGCNDCPPDPDLAICCAPDQICSRKKGRRDDRCCFDDEQCVDGECCSTIGSFGEIPCGGKCCASNACCNGACCGQGQICARKSPLSAFTCVAAHRSCTTADDCFSDVDGVAEQCINGECCGGNRVCNTVQGPVCCGGREYCLAAACCPVHEICGSIRLHRVRL